MAYKHLIQVSDLCLPFVTHLTFVQVLDSNVILDGVLKFNKLISNKKKARCLLSVVRKGHSLTQNCTDYLIVPDTTPTVPVVPPQSGLVTFMVSHQNTKRAQARKKVRFCQGALDKIAMFFFSLQRCKAPVCITLTTEIEPFILTCVKATYCHNREDVSDVRVVK